MTHSMYRSPRGCSDELVREVLRNRVVLDETGEQALTEQLHHRFRVPVLEGVKGAVQARSRRLSFFFMAREDALDAKTGAVTVVQRTSSKLRLDLRRAVGAGVGVTLQYAPELPKERSMP
jgi:hypothetical protein